MPRPRSIPQTTVKEIRAVIALGEDQVMARMIRFIESVKDTRAVSLFRKQEANLLDRVRAQALMALDEALLDPARRAKIYPQSLAWIYGVLYDKMRLERGESTANVSVLSALVEQVHRPRPLADLESATSDLDQDARCSRGNGPRSNAAMDALIEAPPDDQLA